MKRIIMMVGVLLLSVNLFSQSRDQMKLKDGTLYDVTVIISGKSSEWKNPNQLKVTRGNNISYYDISSIIHYTTPSDPPKDKFYFNRTQINNINPKTSTPIKYNINDEILTDGLEFNIFIESDLNQFSLKYIPKMLDNGVRFLNEKTIIIASLSGIFILDIEKNVISLVRRSDFNSDENLKSYYMIDYVNSSKNSVVVDKMFYIKSDNYDGFISKNSGQKEEIIIK